MAATTKKLEWSVTKGISRRIFHSYPKETREANNRTEGTVRYDNIGGNKTLVKQKHKESRQRKIQKKTLQVTKVYKYI